MLNNNNNNDKIIVYTVNLISYRCFYFCWCFFLYFIHFSSVFLLFISYFVLFYLLSSFACYSLLFDRFCLRLHTTFYPVSCLLLSIFVLIRWLYFHMFLLISVCFVVSVRYCWFLSNFWLQGPIKEKNLNVPVFRYVNSSEAITLSVPVGYEFPLSHSSAAPEWVAPPLYFG